VDAQVAVQIQVHLVVVQAVHQAVVALVAADQHAQVQVAHRLEDQVLQRNLHHQDQLVVVLQVVAR
jgi:hypothetical protein